jgi:glyoxylase-like metal-dependent hydrolase (beta-lactamase superfamily II)
MKIHTLDLHFLQHDETIASFLIVGEQGELALVETGPHSTFEALKAGITDLGFDIEQIKHVFLTHIHFDHAGAAWALAQQGATIYVHPAGAKHLSDPTKLYNSAKMIYGDKMEYLWGQMNGIDISKIYTPSQGEQIAVGSLQLTAWHTPGHAVHHIAWQLGDTLFTGDVAGVRIGTGIVVPPCPPPDIDLEAWENSIALMKTLNIKTLRLTHFDEVTNIEEHLTQLQTILWDWANWIKPHVEAGAKAADITPKFQAYVAKQLHAHGIEGELAARYESANPAWMSVAGLLRYWSKKAKAQ